MQVYRCPQTGGSAMKINDIRAIAKSRGLKMAIGMSKADIIKAVQTQEGNAACFGTDPVRCGQTACLWREDCVRTARQQ